MYEATQCDAEVAILEDALISAADFAKQKKLMIQDFSEKLCALTQRGLRQLIESRGGLEPFVLHACMESTKEFGATWWQEDLQDVCASLVGQDDAIEDAIQREEECELLLALVAESARLQKSLHEAANVLAGRHEL